MSQAFINGCSQAFPDETTSSGLSKREYFAGLALQGILANPNPGGINQSVIMAVQAADALLLELSKQP